MESYIKQILNKETDEASIIKSFYFEPATEIEIQMYKKDELEFVANYMFSLLKAVSTSEIVDIIEEEKAEIKNITTANIPQFSNIDAIDDVLGIVKSNPGCNFELIGYYFNKEGKKGAQVKYGENHYKTAALLQLTSWNAPYHITYLGETYLKYDYEDRLMLRNKLFLMIPIIQKGVIEAKKTEINMLDELRIYLSESTALRRKSNVKKMFDILYKTDAGVEFLQTNIIWK